MQEDAARLTSIFADQSAQDMDGHLCGADLNEKLGDFAASPGSSSRWAVSCVEHRQWCDAARYYLLIEACWGDCSQRAL